MKHLSTVDFLRDLGRRVDADYDRGRLESIADVLDDMDAAVLADVERAVLPAPGSTMGLSGATITHRPDIAYAETTRQAQGERVFQTADVEILTRPDARAIVDSGGEVFAAQHVAAPLGGPFTHVVPGNAGTIQAPEQIHAAEPAKIGTETR